MKYLGSAKAMCLTTLSSVFLICIIVIPTHGQEKKEVFTNLKVANETIGSGNDTTGNTDVGISYTQGCGTPSHSYLKKGETKFHCFYNSINLEDICIDSIAMAYQYLSGSYMGSFTHPEKKWASIAPLNWINGVQYADNKFYSPTIVYPVQSKRSYNTIFIDTKSLQVGNVERVTYSVCSETSGGTIQVRTCVMTWPQYFHIIPYSISLVECKTINGSMQNVMLKWKRPVVKYWNIHHYAIFRNDLDSIRIPGLNNSIKVLDSIALNDTSLILINGSRGISSYYAIVGYDYLGEAIALSNSIKPSFAGSAFSLLSPKDGSVEETLLPTFSWEFQQGSIYELWLSDDSLFTNPYKILNLSQSNYTLTEVLQEHHFYFWKVKRSDGLFSDQTSWRFSTNIVNLPPSVFALLQPADNEISTVNPILFTWQPASDPGDSLGYRLQIAKDSAFSSIVTSTSIPNNYYFAVDALPEDTLLFWRVFAKDSQNDSSRCMSIRKFFINHDDAPGGFRTIRPEITVGDTIVQTGLFPKFTWSSAKNSDPLDQIHYTLMYSTDTSFTNPVIISGLVDTTYVPIQPLIEDSYYYWKVKATDNSNQETWSYGLPSCFVTNSFDKQPEPFKITHPLPNQNISGSLNVSWTNPVDDIYDIHHFTFMYSIDSTFTNKSTIWCGETLGTTINLPMGDYYIKASCRSKRIDPANPLAQCMQYAGSSISNVVHYYHGVDTTITNPSINVWAYTSSGQPYLKGVDSLEAAVSYQLTWGSNNVNKVKIEFSVDGGLSWSLYRQNIAANLGSYPGYQIWIPNFLSNDFRVKVTDISNQRAYDISVKNYVVIAPNKQLQIIQPNRGDSLKENKPFSIQWNDLKVDSVKLFISTNGGNTWNLIADKIGGNSYTWLVPATPSTTCLIKVQDYFYPTLASTSNGFFTIYLLKRLHVSKLGNDNTGDGSAQFPYATIQKAVNVSKSYDSIYIAGGTYYESVLFPQPSQDRYYISGGYNPVTWDHDPSNFKTIINPQNNKGISVKFSSSNEKFLLTDISVINASHGFEIRASATAWTYETVTLRNLEATQCYRGIIIYSSGFNMDRCRFANCHTGAVLDAIHWKNVTISNSTFEKISEFGIITYDISWRVYFAANLQLRNNTFFRTKNCLYLKTSNGFTGSCSAENNIFYKNYSIATLDVGITLTNSHNDFFANTLVPPNLDPSNIFIDPMVTDTTTANFHLLDNSPCIGAGILNNLANDFDGNIRPYPSGSNPDIGAYESVLGNPISFVGSNSPVCQGDQILLSCNGGTMAICNTPGNIYSWTGPNGFTSSEQNPTILSGSLFYNSGTYTLTVVSNGINYSGYADVVILPVSNPSITASTSNLCQGSIDLVNYSTQPGMASYSWVVDSGGTPGSATGTTGISVNWSAAPAGTHTVSLTVIDNQGCQSTAVQNVLIQDLPTPTISGPDLACENQIVQYYSQNGMLNYSWSVSPGGSVTGGLGTNAISVSWDTPGLRSISVDYTNTNGCSAITPVVKNVSVNNLPQTPTAISPSITICSGLSGTVTANYIQGTGISMKWYSNECGSGSSIGTGSVINVNPLVTTTYFTRTEADGCSPSTCLSATVSVQNPPTASITYPGNPYCSNGGMATVLLVGTPGGTYSATPMGLELNPMTGIVNLAASAPGTYLVTYAIAASGGCGVVTATSPITINMAPAAIAISNSPICVDGTLMLTGLPPNGINTYAWSGPASFSSIDSLNTTWLYPVTMNNAGTYNLVVTAMNGCTSTATTNVIVSLPTFGGAVTPNTSVCAGTNSTMLTLTGQMGNIVKWQSSFDGITWTDILNTTPTYTAINLTTTTQYRSVVQSGACVQQVSSAAIVVVNPLPITPTSVIASPSSICFGGSSTLTAIGGSGSIVKWYTGICGGDLVGTGTAITVTPNATTKYYARWENICGVSQCASVIVTVIPPFIVGTISANQSICFNGTPTMLTSTPPSGGIGPVSNQWQSSSDGIIFADISGATGMQYEPGPLTSTTFYRLRQIPSSGCGNTLSNIVIITILPWSPPTISGPASICQGTNSYNYTTEPGMYSYLWTVSPGGAITTGAWTSQITVVWYTLGPQTVSVNYTNGNGCTSEVPSVKSILVNPAPTVVSIMAIPSNTVFTGGIPTTLYLGYGPQSVTLSATATGGTGFTYSWTSSTLGMAGLTNPTSANPVFTPTEEGRYVFTLTVTNSNGCSASSSITICVMDIRVPNQNNKVYLCHNQSNPQTLAVSTNSVPAHVPGHPGDYLGQCNQSCDNIGFKNSGLTGDLIVSSDNSLSTIVYPNPFKSDFTLIVETESEEPITAEIYDLTGRLLKVIKDIKPNVPVVITNDLSDGFYMLHIRQGSNDQKVKIVKNR